jgi:hypothetical protein
LGTLDGDFQGTDGLARKAVAMPRDERILGLTSTLAEMLGAEVPPAPPQYYTIQRRGARVRLRLPVPVQLHLWDASLVDISLSGALLEHTARVRPGEVYRLAFRVEGRPVQLLARAFRSFISRLVPVGKGEGQVVYRTGMEFVGGENSMAALVSTHSDGRRQPEQIW